MKDETSGAGDRTGGRGNRSKKDDDKRTYKDSEDRRSRHWRREPDPDPVHDEYENRRCKRNCGTDPPAGAMEAAKALGEIKRQISIPLIADIHFDYRLAIAAIENGADKIRINPGNIGSQERVLAVVDAARERDVPIRVGVNSGSLEKEIIEKYGGVTADGLVESALDKVHWIESMDYNNLVVSIKSSDVLMCAEARRPGRLYPETSSRQSVWR